MNYNPFSLEGKTILITGAAGGIGRVTSVECTKLGAKVILTDVNETGLKETMSILEGKDHSMYCVDLTDQTQIDELIAYLPPLDGLVSNAGVTKPSPVKFIKKADLERVMSINTFAPICLTQRLIKQKNLKMEVL